MDRPIYMAYDERTGSRMILSDRTHTARQQLLAKLGRQHAERMYVDDKDGNAHHVGYIAAGGWWTIYEVRPAKL